MEYYIAVKNNELMKHITIWMNLKNLCWLEEVRHKGVLTVQFHFMKLKERQNLNYDHCNQNNDCPVVGGLAGRRDRGVSWYNGNIL